MALSNDTKRRLVIALTDEAAGQEVAAAIEAGSNEQAAAVAALGTTSNLSPAVVAATTIADSDLTAAIPAEPTKDEVDAGIDTLRTAVVVALDVKADNADLETLRTQAEARLDAIEAKVDALLAALKASGQMAT